LGVLNLFPSSMDITGLRVPTYKTPRLTFVSSPLYKLPVRQLRHRDKCKFSDTDTFGRRIITIWICVIFFFRRFWVLMTLDVFYIWVSVHHKSIIYSKTCLKRNAIVPVFFSVFTGFRFTKGCVLIKQSTKNMIA